MVSAFSGKNVMKMLAGNLMNHWSKYSIISGVL